MRSHSNNIEIRRCRPLLGTFVEMTASGLDETDLHGAINAAFAAMETIHRLMSVHDPNSELSRLNREAASRAVSVSAQTFEVLRRAGRMARESDGAFDHTVAPTLARWRLRPATLKRRLPGGWRDVRLFRRHRVRFRRPLALDLGGIAKGFAVDAAIEVLREHGVVQAVVNAGGDLRVFGPRASVIHFRHPALPHALAGTIDLQEGALATSSPCFTESRCGGRLVSHLVNSRSGKPILGPLSVSVRARECWLADALTKVVLNAPVHRAETLLARHNAQAMEVTV